MEGEKTSRKEKFETSIAKLACESEDPKTQPTAANISQYNRLQLEIREVEERQNFCQSLGEEDLYFGKVIASSGYRMTEDDKHALDWALIEVDEKRVGGNKVSHPLSP